MLKLEIDRLKNIIEVKFESFEKILKEYKDVFITIFIIGILIHLYALTNKLINWDESGCLFSKGGNYELGRWALNVTSLIFPNYSMPTFNGIIAIFLVSISACLISHILEIKGKLNKILVGLIMISFPSMLCTLTYTFTVHSYMLAMFMSVLSAYFANKNTKTSFVFSIILLVISLGIYQAYISMTATLLLILLIKKSIKQDEIKEIISVSLKFFSILIISLVSYAVINKVVVSILNISLTGYQGISSMGKYTVIGFLKGVFRAYRHSISAIFTCSLITPTKINCIIYGICYFVNLFILGKVILRNKENKLNLLFLIGFVLLLPISMNMIYILNENVTNHALMMFADTFIYIILISCIDEDVIKTLKHKILQILIILQIFVFSIIANEAYLEMHLAYENTYSFYQGIITSIKNTEGFNENSKIAIIGDYKSKELQDFKEFRNLLGFTGIPTNIELINSYSRIGFIKNYLGFDGNFISEDESLNILEGNEEFEKMSNYPYYGSIKKIGDIVVVKLSE